MASALLRNKSTLWDAALELLPNLVGQVTFDSFLRNAVPVSFEGAEFALGVPSDFGLTWVTQRHLGTLDKCLSELAEEPISVRLVVVPSEAAPRPPTALEPVHSAIVRQAPYSSQPLNHRYTFESFVVGTCNQFAHAAASQVGKAPGTTYNVLFLHSKVGLGKTHLMQAIGHYVREHHPQYQVAYVSGEQFVNDLISSIRDNRADQFRNHYRSVDIWLVDDIQFIAQIEGPVSQEEFFHTFNALYETGKQIVIASDRPPRQLQIMDERLRSRLQQGIVADLRPPDIDTRLAILEKKAQAEGMPINRDILMRIAQQIESNVRVLEGALMTASAYASLYKTELTPPIVDELLRDYSTDSTHTRVSIEEIAAYVAGHFDVSVEELQSNSRRQQINRARQTAIYLCRELTDQSLHNIGRFFGGRDHSTIIHAYKKVSSNIEKDPQTLWLINNMKATLSE